MTDEDLSVDGLSSAVSAGETSPASQEVPSERIGTQAVAEQEKLLTQNEVNNMIGAAKRKAYEKGLDAAQTQGQTTTQSQNSGAQAGLDESRVREIINSQITEVTQQQYAAAEKQRYQRQAEQITGDIAQKMVTARESIPDFDNVMERVNFFDGSPAVVHAVHTLDNPAEVLYHLANNPRDIPAIDALSKAMPAAATAELQKISDRLKQNENGKKSPHAPNPISQIDTNVRDGIGGTEPASISDFRSIYKG